MINHKDHTIDFEASVKEAMRKINAIPQTLTLFVLNKDEKLIGTLTDGDIRRGLLDGKNLDDKASVFMSEKFHYLTDLKTAPQQMNDIRARGIHLLPLLDEKHKIRTIFDLRRLKNVLPLDCLLMAGGRGERLRPLTDDTPKPLLKVGSKPIIEHNIDHIINFGVQHYHISVKYLAEKIKTALGDGSSKHIDISYIDEEKPLGTIGCLKLIPNLKHDAVLVMNSDLFTNFDLEEFYLDFIQNDADISIATVPYSVNVPYAVLEREERNVTGLKEKPSYTYQSNAGIYLIKKELIELIPLNEKYDATDLIEAAIQLGKKVTSYQILGYWIDIGKPEDFAKVQEIAKHIHK